MEERPLETIATDKPRFCAYVAIFAIDLWSKKVHSIKRYGLGGLKSNFFLSQVTNPLISCIWKTKLISSPLVQKLNKTLWERLFGHGRTTGMILWTCLIAAKQLSSYLTREDKSFTPLVCWTTQLIQYVPIHNKNSVISRQCLKICTSSMQKCLEPNCNIGHKWLQPGE